MINRECHLAHVHAVIDWYCFCTVTAANAMKGDKEKCIAAGMDDYISKPVEKKRLEEVLARWLGSAVVT